MGYGNVIVTMLMLCFLVACTGAQLMSAGDATGTAAEVAGTTGAVTGNPVLLGAGIGLSVISVGLTAVGRFLKSQGK